MAHCNVTAAGLASETTSWADSFPSPWGSTLVASIPAVSEFLGALIAFMLPSGIPVKVHHDTHTTRTATTGGD